MTATRYVRFALDIVPHSSEVSTWFRAAIGQLIQERLQDTEIRFEDWVLSFRGELTDEELDAKRDVLQQIAEDYGLIFHGLYYLDEIAQDDEWILGCDDIVEAWQASEALLDAMDSVDMLTYYLRNMDSLLKLQETIIKHIEWLTAKLQEEEKLKA
jgi:hypothetical protein